MTKLNDEQLTFLAEKLFELRDLDLEGSSYESVIDLLKKQIVADLAMRAVLDMVPRLDKDVLDEEVFLRPRLVATLYSELMTVAQKTGSQLMQDAADTIRKQAKDIFNFKSVPTDEQEAVPKRKEGMPSTDPIRATLDAHRKSQRRRFESWYSQEYPDAPKHQIDHAFAMYEKGREDVLGDL